jgi:hypothetical protein
MADSSKNPPPPLIVTTPGEPVREIFQLIFKTTGKVVACPFFRVQPGMIILIQPINGSEVNTEPCSVADRASLVGTSSATTLPPGQDVAVNWDSSQIYAAGTEGDGILITFSQAAFG